MQPTLQFCDHAIHGPASFMKTKKPLLTCLIAVHAIVSVEAQGTFQNLGFESATLVPTPEVGYPSVQFASAFPGWAGYIGGVQRYWALYDSSFLDSSGISIIDSNWPHWYGPNAGLISGNYTALLIAGVTLDTIHTPVDTALSQTSLVPVSAQSLRFRVYTVPSDAPFRVELGGQELPLFALGSSTNYTVYGADIRMWQNQLAELSFTLITERPHRNNRYLFLDRIQFSPDPIPEPGVLGLIGLGALLLGWRLRKL